MPHPLDDRSFVTRFDPKGMLALADGFPAQCRRALEIGLDAEIPAFATKPAVVMLTGLGGSAAGGDFVRALFDGHGAAPFVVNRDYHLPNYVGLGDLVFCASYSGNTEETLSAYADAKRAGAKIVAVTSGGQLAEMARADGHTVITVPGGQPPRTALGYMMVPVIVACQRLKLIPEQDFSAVFATLDRCAKSWSVGSPFDSNEAKRLAQAIHGKLAVIYGLGGWQGLVANRWKGQINENAKNLAFNNAFPELNHNEVLGWVGAAKQGVAKWVCVMLEDGRESEKMKARGRITRDLIGNAVEFHTVQASGESLLERMLSLIYLADYVSIYLAALNGVDPENIDWLNTLKSELGKIG